MVHVQVITPPAWIVRMVISLIIFVIIARILRSEVKKRRLATTQFYSKYLRFTSAVCIWLAPITPLFIFLSVIPGFCTIRLIGSAMMFYTQFVFLGFYQLSRLHYCFSDQQLHGNKGYPLWVFVMMISIGIMGWISALILHLLVDTLPSKCGYTDNGSLFYRFRARAILFDGDSWEDEWLAQIWWIWINTLTISSHSWDLTILLLYLFKIYQIGKVHKSKENRVWNNVLFILHRIVIITVFYHICSLTLTILFSILSLNQFSENTLVNAIVTEIYVSGGILAYNSLCFFSILLMMDHNTNLYVVLLHFLRNFHLKYCCFCCCHKMVDRQLQHLDPSQALAQGQARSSGEKLEIEKRPSATMFSNLSKNVNYKSNVSAVELSCETVTHIVNDDTT